MRKSYDFSNRHALSRFSASGVWVHWRTAYYFNRPTATTFINGTTAGTFYHVFDPQFSTLAILQSTGRVRERVEYSAFGHARHHQCADIDGDGAGADQAAISNLIGTCYGSSGIPLGHACYHAEADLNRDGVITNSGPKNDGYSLAGSGGGTGASTPLAPGEISCSDVHNIFGWNGAVNSCWEPQRLARVMPAGVHSPDIVRLQNSISPWNSDMP